MKTGAYQIAVLDIGKTNKKILVYSSNLEIIEQRITQIPEIVQGEILMDDTESIKSWIVQTLKELNLKHKIKAIATSAHGATYSLLNEDMEHVTPQIAYNTDPGESFHRDFYELCGDSIELQKQTATPNFNLLINPAKGIFFTKKLYPKAFREAKHLILYAQYYGAWLTGEVCADPTYVGNHSYLWDFERNTWSDVCDRLEVKDLLPDKFLYPWQTMGKVRKSLCEATGLSEDTVVTAGIHDSNAALLPYIISMNEPFILNSTGTWCVIMNEEQKVDFKEEELGKVVFYNMSAFWKPIKTSIFLGGMEFDHYAQIFQKIHQRDDYPEFNLELYQRLIKQQDKFILPSVAPGIGQFPDSVARIVEHDEVYHLSEIESGLKCPHFFENYDEAFAILNLSLVIQTKVSFSRAGFQEGMKIFTEGGFTRNSAYNALMASIYAGSGYFLTNLLEASAYGAALTAKSNVEELDILSLGDWVNIDKNAVQPYKIEGLDAYEERFMSLI